MRPAGPLRPDRPRAARILQVAGALLGVAAILLSGLRLGVVDEDRFVGNAGRAIESPPVATLVGEELTRQVLRVEPDLLAVQPVVQTAITGVAGSSAGAGLVRTAARQLHRTAVAGDPDTALLRLGTLGLLATQTLRTLSPDVADRIPDSVDATLVALDEGPTADVVSRVTDTTGAIRRWSWATTVGAVLLLAASVLLRRERASALRRVGLVVAATGACGLVAHLLLRSTVVGALTDRDTRDAGRAVYDAFLGGTASLATATVAAGLVLSVATGALTRREPLSSTVVRRVRDLAATPRGARSIGIGGAVLGGLLLVDRDLAARVLATVAGLGLLAVGLEVAVRAGEDRRTVASGDDAHAAEGSAPSASVSVGVEGSPQDDAASRDRRPAGTGRSVSNGRSRLRAAAVAGIAIVLLVAVGGTTDRALRVSATPTGRCDGSAALCDRRLDEVVLPATHNAFSSASDGFLLANQQTGIPDQLRGGVRGLLIDTYEAQPVSGAVLTRLDRSPDSRAKIEDSIGADATRTALRLRERLASGKRGPVDVYLCHGFCELGAVRALDVLRQVRRFLGEHPEEVLVISVEDQVAPARFARLVRDAGLLDLTWRGPVRPLPTLGEMVGSGGRVLWLAENDAGDVPWLHRQFDLAQETPYDLTAPSALLGDPGCVAGRGGTRPPLFLLNHFLGTVPPRPSSAAEVNGRAAIVEHVDRCRATRGRLPNLVAVDFWKTGDVVGATRELNARPGAGR